MLFRSREKCVVGVHIVRPFYLGSVGNDRAGARCAPLHGCGGLSEGAQEYGGLSEGAQEYGGLSGGAQEDGGLLGGTQEDGGLLGGTGGRGTAGRVVPPYGVLAPHCRARRFLAGRVLHLMEKAPPSYGRRGFVLGS